jgi:hypothetical protein
MKRLVRSLAPAAAAILTIAAGLPPTPTIDRVEKLFDMTFNDTYLDGGRRR